MTPFWPTTKPLSDILDVASDWLTEAGLRLVVDVDNAHRFRAWEQAEAEHGPDIALIHAPEDEGPLGSEFKVHWNYRYPHHAQSVVDAFMKAGCVATWDGHNTSAVQVKAEVC